MPITVACECGRKLKAPDQLAGRKAKCPSCGAVLTVPAGSTPLIATAPPLIVQPPAVQPGGSEYDLDLGELAPSSRQSAPTALPAGKSAAAAPAAADDDGRACPACKAPMPQGAVMCEQCGFSPRSGTYIDRTKRGRYAGEDGPKPWFSLLGIDFTPIKTAILAVVLLLLIGLCVWYFTVPGANFRLREVRTVSQVTGLTSLGVIPQGSLLHGTAFTAKPSAGVSAPPGAAMPGGAKRVDNNVYGLGFDGKLLLTREDDKGDWLLMRVDLRQSYIENHKQMSDYDLLLLQNSFKLDIDGKPQDVILIPAELGTPLTVELGDSTASDYHSMLPPDVPITTSTGDEPRRGEVTYDGKNGVSGKVEYVSIYMTYRMAGSSGLSGTGKLELKDARGIEATYDYGGDQLQVQWNDGTRAWRSTEQWRKKTDLSPWAKHEVWLLTPRPPKTAQRVRLVYCGDEVAKIKQRYSSRSEQPVATSTPQGPAGPPKKDLLDKAGEQMGGYIGALANARRRAQGTVASSNIRQILLGVQMYIERHREPPEKLEDLRLYLDDGFDKLLFNPRTKENPGYIYVKPNPDDVRRKPAADIPVVYEALYGKIDPDGAIGYLDGSVEQGSAAPLKDPPPPGAQP